MKRWILVSDLDGTLLNSDHNIASQTAQAIERFVDAGHLFTFATGRIAPSARRFATQLNLSLPGIVGNGGGVYDFTDNVYLVEHFLDPSALDLLVFVLENYHSVGITLVEGEEIKVLHSNAMVEYYLKVEGYPASSVAMEDVGSELKKILLTGDRDQLEAVERWLKGQGDRFYIVFSHEHFLEILPLGINKMLAFDEMCRSLGITLGPGSQDYNFAAIGDNHNDLELLQGAGRHGWAVANARPEVLQAVTNHCPSNDDYGLVWLIDHLMAGAT